MSRWILKSAANVQEPVSFQRLAQLLANGEIDENDEVRPDDSRTWQTVDSIIGLRRAADRLRLSSPSTSVHAAESDTSPREVENETVRNGPMIVRVPISSPPDWNEADHARPLHDPVKPFSRWRVLLLIGAIGFVGWYGWSHWTESRRFPTPSYLISRPQTFSLPFPRDVGLLEVTLLTADMTAVSAFGVWWFVSKRRSR
jgi:hypothetical protein